MTRYISKPEVSPEKEDPSIVARIFAPRLPSTTQYLLLGLITFVAVALRFYKLGEWSFWIDEVWSIIDALGLGASKTDLFEFHVLFYPMIRPILMSLGINEWSARLVPAIIGTVSIPILFFPTRKIFGSWVAIFAAGLLAIAPWHLFWSQNVRYYTLLLLLYSLSLLFFYWGLETGQFRYIIASWITWILALLTNLTAAFLFPTILVYVLLLKVLPVEKPRGLHLKSLVPFVLLPLVYLLYEVYRVAFTGKALAVSKLLSFFLVGQSLGPVRLVAGVIYYVGVPLVCLALFGGLWLLLEKRRSGLFLLVGVLVPLFILILLSPFVYVHDRYVFLTLPLWIILGATAVWGIFSRVGEPGRILALGVIVLLLADPIAQNWLYFDYQNGNRWDWKGAFATVQQRKAEDDLVVTTWVGLGRYYINGEVMSMHELDPLTVVESGRRMWFVDDGWVNPALSGWLQENAELVDVRDVHMPGKVFPMRVYLYNPARPRVSAP
jgi:mannosyltransferase